MKDFMDEHFLLTNDFAERLYLNYARDMPIFDYHNHLPPKEICERKRYSDLAELWLSGDHYKWRAMRIMGIDEHFITGNASGREKFQKWAETIERMPGSSLYHWTAMELKLYFGITKPLNTDTAEDIWQETKEKLKEPSYDSQGLLEMRRVRVLCTTDEPADSLEWHMNMKESYKAGKTKILVLPTFRPDKLIRPGEGYPEAVAALAAHYGKISSLGDLKAALSLALDHFQSAGSVLADHGYLTFHYTREGNPEKAFQKALSGERLTESEEIALCSNLQFWLGTEYAKRRMTMQMHIGARRNNNGRLFRTLGADSGGDSVGSITDPKELSDCLNDLLMADSLPNTVLYCLNPADNPVFSTMAVNFACSEAPGKVQFGAAWWFADTLRGISRQLDELIETGLLPVSLGMLTDSRSFTSFARHDYFRRILCSKLGDVVEKGEYPADEKRLGKMVQDISYDNVTRYLGVKEAERHK